MSMLDVEGVSSGYGELIVLDGVSISIQEGELVSVIGPNGAGKTTLLRTIAGTVPPREGSITFRDKDITELPPTNTIKLGMGYVPQDNHIFPSLTVRENLEMGAYTSPDVDFKGRVDEITAIFPPLKDRMKQKAGTMSGGQQQMVAISRGLMVRPDLLMLDEPTAGLQPSLVQMMLDKVKRINEDGVTILLVAQTIKSLRLSTRANLLSGGQVALSGDTEELVDNERVEDLYFGG